MALFKVTNIIDGNTIEVAGWKWNDFAGKRIKIRGYVVEPSANDFAKAKLEILLTGKEVELKAPFSAEKGDGSGNDIITCVVWLNDIDISKHFLDFKNA